MTDDIRRHRIVLVVLLLVSCLLAAACGTRLTDDERALYTAANDSSDGGDSGTSGSQQATTRTTVRSGSNSPGATVAGSTGNSDTGGDAAQGGDAGGQSTDGGQPVAAAGGEACAASASVEKGVSDEAIDIGAVFQLSGPIPGFAQQALNGAQAYVAFVNATGGLCGRELRYQVADDAFEASRNASEAKKLEPNVLAFGGGFSVSDSGMATALAGTNVLDVAVATTPERQGYENLYSHLVSNGGPPVDPEWKYAASKGAKKGIIVHVAAAAARNEAVNVRESMSGAGIDAELLEISNTQFSFSGPARNVMDSGAQIMVFISDLNASVQMVAEMRELGKPLPFEWYRIAYGQEFLDRAAGNAEGAMAFLEFLPFEEAGANQEMATYIEWLKRVAPDANPTFDSVNTWISMKLLVQAIRGVEGDITRDSLLASMQRITTYDAGGLIEPMNPADRETKACKLLVRVKGGKWVREAPPSGFLC